MEKKLEYYYSRGGKISFLYAFMFLAEIPVTKDRLTRKNHTHLLNISFM